MEGNVLLILHNRNMITFLVNEFSNKNLMDMIEGIFYRMCILFIQFVSYFK